MNNRTAAREFIDAIMNKLKSESFNQLIIVAEYSRRSDDLYNKLEILERCLNGAVDSSTMLIINKAPNKNDIKKALKENPNFDVDKNLKNVKDEIARIFGFRLSAEFTLVNELDDVDEKQNDTELDRIRNLIGSSESYQFSNIKTWSELVEMCNESKNSKESQIKLIEQIKIDLEDQIKKNISNITFNESQLDLINKGQSFMKEVCNPIKYLINSAFYSDDNFLTNYKAEKDGQISKLKKDEEVKDFRLYIIKKDNDELNKEIERHSAKINRLLKNLRD